MKKKYFITGFIIILGILVLSKVSINNNKDLAVYIENELNSSIPANNENLYVNKIDCDNNVNAYWDNDNWGLFISNFSKKTKCNLYFIHDTQKPYWQIEEVEKTSVLSTDIFTIKISGNDSLSKVTSSLDTSSLSFYVNDTLQSPIKVELTKLEELNKKITYSIKVHMVGGEGNLKLKINSNTLTDNETNQNDEIILDTGITVSKNPAKILHYYAFENKDYSPSIEPLLNYYSNINSLREITINDVINDNYDLVFIDYYAWEVPTIANDIFNNNIKLVTCGNDSTDGLDIIKSYFRGIKLESSTKVIDNKLTYYMPNIIGGDGDGETLINFNENVTTIFRNNSNGNNYDTMGYLIQNNNIWFHSQNMYINKYIIPIIQFTLGNLNDFKKK